MKVKQTFRSGKVVAVRPVKLKPFTIEIENAVRIRLVSVDEVNEEATLEIKMADEKPVTLYLSKKLDDVFYGHLFVDVKI